jgi:putative ABC transport system permease protein
MRLIFLLALRNLRSDWFGTWSSIFGVALGIATVDIVLTIDVNTRSVESTRWETNPDLEIDLSRTVRLAAFTADGRPLSSQDAKEETHEDYQVMRSAIRLGSLSAFLVGALIVFFTFRVVVEQRRREVALLRSLGTLPGQIAKVFLLEALIVGTLGAALGLFLSVPMSLIAVWSGISTTGRVKLGWLWFPWKQLMFVSAVGGFTAVLGVLKPLHEILRLDVPKSLRPQFMEEGSLPRRTSGVAMIAIPFMALLYVLVRPFFFEVLPSLAFFIVEAGLVCAGFLSMIVLVPQVVSIVGGIVSRALPGGPKAARLLTSRRIERAGHEFAWAVSGVMLVFALLLSLHIVTRSLEDEVVAWARSAIRDNAYIFARWQHRALPAYVLEKVPPHVVRVRYSGRTRWPNPILAVDRLELARFAESIDERSAEIAGRLVKGKVILSKLMARRLGASRGDFLEVTSKVRTDRLEIVAVTDDLGYMPMIGPYRDSKTYGLISSDDFDLIDPYTGDLGTGVALRDPTWRGTEPPPFWREMLSPAEDRYDIRIEVGAAFEAERVEETNRDFLIFDVILFLTAVLAAIGIANNLVLSAHVRRREIALYRVLGMQSDQIRTLYLMEGGFIGALGGVMAAVLGIPLGFAAIGALKIVSAFDVHFQLPPSYVGWTIAGAVLVSFAAALYPASRASGLSSAESVHYE